jgi:hypothetical protein
VEYFCDGFYDFSMPVMIYGGQIHGRSIRRCFLAGLSHKGMHFDYGRPRQAEYTHTIVNGDSGTIRLPDDVYIANSKPGGYIGGGSLCGAVSENRTGD